MIPLNPVKYIRFAARVVWNSWRHRRSAGFGIVRQAREAAALLQLNQLEPHEYYEYELHDGHLTWEEKCRFISHHQASRFYTEVNKFAERGALNKLSAHQWFARLGLRTSRLFGVFDRACGHAADGSPLRTLGDLQEFIASADFEKFVVKPLASQRGFGIKVIEILGKDQLEDSGQGVISVAQLYDAMTQSHYNLNGAQADTYLFEEYIRQHPNLDRFADSCTQCLRIVTYITMDGAVEVLNCNFKLGEQGNVFDNTRDRGLAAPASGDGVLRRGVSMRDGRRMEYEKHPQNDAQIEGTVLPYYAEAIALAMEAQSLIPQVRSIGWDIAITATGPVIIEGNVTWSRKTQQYTRVGMITPAVRKELARIV